MRKIFIISFVVFCISSFVYAKDTVTFDVLKQNNEIQTRIDNIATKLLNINKITKRIVFVYNSNEKNKTLLDSTLTKRQVVVYNQTYNSIQTDDELALVLAREIALAHKSYDGLWGGKLSALQVYLSPKKFEIYADKKAVDYAVKAGYNPLALIVYINKTCPQKRGDLISRHNLTSKRLARIYEYITFKYPQFLDNNEYVENEYYQNFLLTSINNRLLLDEKINTGSSKEIKYE